MDGIKRSELKNGRKALFANKLLIVVSKGGTFSSLVVSYLLITKWLVGKEWTRELNRWFLRRALRREP